MSVEQKIVYAGLSRLFDDKTAIQSAFRYWLNHYATKDFDVIEVTSAFVSYLGLNSQEKKVLMVGLHAASNKSGIQLEEVPAYILENDAEVQQRNLSVDKAISDKKINKPHYEITAGFIELLSDSIRRNEPNSFREIDDILKDEGLSDLGDRIDAKVKRYGFSNNIMSTKLDEDQCRELAHHLYLLVIDVIGPVNADVYVNKAIDKLLLEQAAAKFDPRSLI